MTDEIINDELLATNEAQPRPFKEIPKLWLKFFQMDEQFFHDEVKHSSVNNTLLSILVLTGFTTLFSAITYYLSYLINPEFYQEFSQQMEMFPINIAILPFIICVGIIGIPINFYIRNSITFICAKIFGGVGEFTTQAYTNSLYMIPLQLVSSILSFVGLIPGAGGCLSFPISLALIIYQIILTVRSFKAVHHFSTNRAVAAILSPLLLFILLPLCAILILMLMGPMIGNVFSSINAGY